MKLSSARSLAASALAGALALLVAAVPRPSTAAYPPSAEGRTIAVATDHSDATRAALDVLAHGGNAADAAVAAALALGVVSPSASGIGGGGFALVHTAKDGKTTAFDFRETAPSSYRAELLFPPRKPGEPPKDRWAWTGPRGTSVGVPGEPAGLELLVRRFGRRSLADDAAPAVALAQRGFYVSRHAAESAVSFRSRIETLPSLAGPFLPGGVPIALGTRVRRPDLAATLQRFGSEGKRAIYEGATAQKIEASVQRAGGTLTRADLAAYEVKERAPLVRTIDGRTVVTMPAPSAGGLMLMETLSMFGASSSSSIASYGFGSSAYLHVVAEAMRGAVADRARLAGDPDVDPSVDPAYQAALDPGQLAARKARIDPTKTRPAHEYKTREQGTSHLVVADAEGNIVSLTTTINGPFGASIVAGDTGILLNNQLDDFSAPDDVKAFGVEDGGPNRPRPRARPVSSMTPTIVFEGGKPILAVGGSGGTRIATSVTQATLARLLFDLDPVACVSHPRVHVQGSDLLVDREIAPDVRMSLSARGENVRDEPFTGSAVQMIAWGRSPTTGKTLLFAASDPRKGGFAAAR